MYNTLISAAMTSGKIIGSPKLAKEIIDEVSSFPVIASNSEIGDGWVIELVLEPPNQNRTSILGSLDAQYSVANLGLMGSFVFESLVQQRGRVYFNFYKDNDLKFISVFSSRYDLYTKQYNLDRLDLSNEYSSPCTWLSSQITIDGFEELQDFSLMYTTPYTSSLFSVDITVPYTTTNITYQRNSGESESSIKSTATVNKSLEIKGAIPFSNYYNDIFSLLDQSKLDKCLWDLKLVVHNHFLETDENYQSQFSNIKFLH